MKTLIVLLACIVSLVGCGGMDNDIHPETSYKVVDIDSCEYLLVSRRPISAEFSLTHKGNCKYCRERSDYIYGAPIDWTDTASSEMSIGGSHTGGWVRPLKQKH